MPRRKVRDQAERERRIVAVARQLAERDGWLSVTIRRLADLVECSQPVLYSHFENRDAIVAAVAIEGFREMASTLTEAQHRGGDSRTPVHRAAVAYLKYAAENPALYEAMFTMPTALRFAQEDTPPELGAAFSALAAVFDPLRLDVELATEAFWASLHGVAELERSGRIRIAVSEQRLNLLVACFADDPAERSDARTGNREQRTP